MITEWVLVALVAGAPGPRKALDTIQAGPLRLGEVLESALATHPTVAGAEARLSASEAGVGEARAAWLPTVSASAVATRHQEPMVVAPLHGFDIRTPPSFDETLYQASASADFTLFDGGARGARVRVAESLEASAASSVLVAPDAVMAEAT